MNILLSEEVLVMVEGTSQVCATAMESSRERRAIWMIFMNIVIRNV